MRSFKGHKVSKKHKDGKPHLAIIEEDPGFAVLVWKEHRESGEVIWEGWFYSDPVLALTCPEGVKPKYILEETKKPEVYYPIDSTYDDKNWAKQHYYSNHTDGREYMTYHGKTVKEWSIELPWTEQQIIAMIERSVNIQNPEYVTLSYCEHHPIDIVARGPTEMVDSSVKHVSALCPVVEFNNYGNTAVVILPDGSKQEVDRSLIR